MSRIGRAPIPVPPTTKVKQEGGQVVVEGPKGMLSLSLPAQIALRLQESTLLVELTDHPTASKALHGLYRALIANMVQGVSVGFQKELEVVGVGFRAQVQGKQLTLTVGFSHPVILPVPEGLTVETPKPTQILIKGADKQLVGQFTATIRRVAPPEPYKGKGIKYAGEVIRRKAGKAATGAGAKSAG